MWTFGRKIAAGFALAFLLLLGIGFVAYHSISTLTGDSHSVTLSHQVLESIADVLNLMNDAETGQRGYIITADDSYLEPYNHALDAIPKDLKQLRDLTAGDPNQQKRLDEAEPLIAGKLAELKETIEVRRTKGFDPALKGDPYWDREAGHG